MLKKLKRPINYGALWRLLACFSLSVNLLITIVLLPKILNKMNIYAGGGAEKEHDYLSNLQYSAACSMFELNDAQANIIFLGDSITARGHWEEFFSQENVLNRGIGSDTSEGVYNRLEEIIARNPKKIFLMIGINDLGYGIKQDRTKYYIDETIQILASVLPDCKIYLESVLPCETISLERIRSLNHEIKTVADGIERCEYIDLYSLFIDETGGIKEGLLSEDGVHLNGDGYRVWIEALQKFIND